MIYRELSREGLSCASWGGVLFCHSGVTRGEVWCSLITAPRLELRGGAGPGGVGLRSLVRESTLMRGQRESTTII